jgi:hypothetical protein
VLLVTLGDGTGNFRYRLAVAGFVLGRGDELAAQVLQQPQPGRAW